MHLKELQLQDAIEQARKAMDEGDRGEALRLTAKAEQMSADIRQDRAIRTALNRDAGPAPDEGFGGFGKGRTLAQAVGLRFVESDLRQMQKAGESGGGYRIKAVQAEADLGPSGGSFIDLSSIAPAVRSTFRVASLIPTSQAGDGGSSVTYYRPSALAEGATAVAESGNIPQSSPEWEPQEEPIRKISHFAHVPTEAVQDWTGFLGMLGSEMIAGLIAVENAAILTGDGSPPNLEGVFARTASQTRPQGTDMDIDAALSAISDVRELAFVEPDALIMRAATYKRLRLTKDAEDRYALGDPAVTGAKSLDGVPIYISPAVPALHIYACAFATTRAKLRHAALLETSNSDNGDFTVGKFKVRVSERFALEVPNEAAFCDLTLNSV